MPVRVAAPMPEAPCKIPGALTSTLAALQCQMRCPSRLRDILLGVTVSLLESEALCVAVVALSVYSPSPSTIPILSVSYYSMYPLHSYFIVAITSARIITIFVDVIVCLNE